MVRGSDPLAAGLGLLIGNGNPAAIHLYEHPGKEVLLILSLAAGLTDFPVQQSPSWPG
jgi:hypothetical protein